MVLHGRPAPPSVRTHIVLHGCEANINSGTSARSGLLSKIPSPLAQTCRTFPVMFPSASRLQAHMVEASMTSAVNMTLIGHTGNSQALEIEPFPALPLQKRRVSITTQKLHFKQARCNMRLLSEPMNFNFHQRNKGEFSFLAHLKAVKAFFFKNFECKIKGNSVEIKYSRVSDQSWIESFSTAT